MIEGEVKKGCNDHIPTDVIEPDIRDTEAEIVQMEREIESLRLIGDRLSLYKADEIVEHIRQGRQFIAKLKGVLGERHTRVMNSTYAN